MLVLSLTVSLRRFGWCRWRVMMASATLATTFMRCSLHDSVRCDDGGGSLVCGVFVKRRGLDARAQRNFEVFRRSTSDHDISKIKTHRHRQAAGLIDLSSALVFYF
jgi:hypothetical protein